MITLATPHAESRFDPAGVEKAFDEVRTRVRQLAKSVAIVSRTSSLPESEVEPLSEPMLEQKAGHTSRMPHCRVFLMSRSGEEVEPAVLRDMDCNPAVARIRRKDSDAARGSWNRANDVTLSMERAIEAFCYRGGRHNHLVVIEDADYYFYPTGQPGDFTRTLDTDKALIDRIGGVGDFLKGNNGHLVIAAAFDQSPERLSAFLDAHGWSWVRWHCGCFEHMQGTLPDVLKNYCSTKPEPVIELDRSDWMTKIRLAKYLGVHRNTLKEPWLRKNSANVEESGGKVRVRLSFLSPEARQRLLAQEGKDLDDRLGENSGD